MKRRLLLLFLLAGVLLFAACGGQAEELVEAPPEELVEVTPEKEVVWVIRDWKHFGPATAVQILSDPGNPEMPGDCQR